MKCFFKVYHQVKRGRFLLWAIIVFFLFHACIKNDVYEAQLKSLDSLSGALNQKLAELKQIDTVILKKAIIKYSNYSQFIQQNVNDTLSKQEGDQLQQFNVSGKNLSDFSENRTIILARGSLLNAQLNKLMLDVKAHSNEEEMIYKFYAEEKQNAEKLIKSTYGQQQLFQSNLQEFKLSLTGIENIIRSRNNGQMPTIIKDSIPL
ncbi:MAG: hypothetical protein HYX39_01030 [Bacteroidetes bacterium]|nr:hypothetical protein [Bacteroidota bacterium]